MLNFTISQPNNLILRKEMGHIDVEFYAEFCGVSNID